MTLFYSSFIFQSSPLTHLPTLWSDICLDLLQSAVHVLAEKLAAFYHFEYGRVPLTHGHTPW